jgi:hypothetical protein
MLALAVGLWGVSRCLPAAAWAWPVKAGLWGLWPLFLWHAGLLSAVEKQYALTFARQAAGFLTGGLAWWRDAWFTIRQPPPPPAEDEEGFAQPSTGWEEEAA